MEKKNKFEFIKKTINILISCSDITNLYASILKKIKRQKSGRFTAILEKLLIVTVVVVVVVVVVVCVPLYYYHYGQMYIAMYVINDV